MRLIDADNIEYEHIRGEFRVSEEKINAMPTIFEISNYSKNGKEILIKYCLEHSGEEIYNLLKRLFDASMSWTDSRSFIIEWLENGGYMI